jgi:hypothetical protein
LHGGIRPGLSRIGKKPVTLNAVKGLSSDNMAGFAWKILRAAQDDTKSRFKRRMD